MKPDTAQAWLGALGGRTFLLTVGAGIFNSILVWHKSITSSDFALVTGATLGAYIAANAYQAVKGSTPDVQPAQS